MTPHNPKKDLWTRLEMPRKIWHMSTGLLAAGFYIFHIDLRVTTILLSIGGLLFGLEEVYRISNPQSPYAQGFTRHMSPLMRSHEVNQINSALWYVLGMVLSLALFPRDITLCAICYLAFADPIASFTGRLWGKYTPRYFNGRTVAGSMGSFVSALAVTYWVFAVMVPSYPTPAHPPVWTPDSSRLSLHGLSWAAALAVALAESFGIPGVDDNLTVPVLSGLALQLILRLAAV